MQFVPMFITFTVSALWHGLRVGFIVMFTGFAMMEIICKYGGRTKLAAWVVKNVPYVVYHPIRWFC